MRALMVVALLTVTGCAVETEQRANCPALSGNYLLTMTRKSGDCGTLDDQVIKAPRAADPNCQSDWAKTVSGCRTEGETVCVHPTTKTQIIERGTCHFSEDARTASCEVQIIIRLTNGDSCSGIYQETLTKQ